MVSRYSIIQYVPNPIADERMNIGVLAFDNENVRVQFLRNWSRVHDFGGENIRFLRDFAKKMQDSVEKEIFFAKNEDKNISRQEYLQKITQESINSIQFTESKASLMDVDTLLQDIVSICLIDSITKKALLRDRQGASKLANSRIKQAVTKYLGGDSEGLLQKHYSISGKHEKHEFDIAVANGHPYFATHGVSFEINPKKNLLDALSYSIIDIKELDQNIPLGIFVLPPKKNLSKNYNDLQKIYNSRTETFREIGAEVLKEDELNDWVHSVLVSTNLIEV